MEKMGPRTKILFIDDNSYMLDSYRKAFERSELKSSIETHFISDYRTARHYLANEAKNIDAIVMDVMLDGNVASSNSGLSLARLVKRELNPDASIIIVSGTEYVRDVISAQEIGVSQFITKQQIASTQGILDQVIRQVIANKEKPLEAPPDPALRSVIQPTWRRLCEVISRDYNNLHSIPPRQFEELVAHMFEEQGFDVELTSQTRDGGHDIIAIKKIGLVSTRLLIEAKRCSPLRKVGVGEIRALYGVRQSTSASQLVLATSSYVSNDAKLEFSRVIPFELDFIERDKILEWCDAQAGINLVGQFGS